MAITNQSEEIVSVHLEESKQAILNRLYPFADMENVIECKGLPKRYEPLCVRLTVYLINKRGAEGQLLHMENGIHRHYESADVPESMLSEVTPYVGIL